MARIEIFPSRADASIAAASAIANALLSGLLTRRRASFAAGSGQTKKPVYALLKDLTLPWSQIRVTLTDERFVPPSSPDSHHRFLNEALFAGAAGDAAFTPLWRAGADIVQAAHSASFEVLSSMPFDVVLLGVGEDGAVASLFPDSPTLADALDPKGPAVMAVSSCAAAPEQGRMSLTMPALLQSRQIVILAEGDRRRRLLETVQSRHSLPIHHLLNQDRVPIRILWAA